MNARQTWLLVTLLAAASAIVILWVTAVGIGLSPDSRSYLNAAKYTALGHGPYAPDSSGDLNLITHFPPLYGMVLGVGEFLFGSATAVSRWLNAFYYAAAVLLSAGLVWRGTGGSRAMTLLAAGLACLSVSMLATHLMLWSEPQFIATMLTGFWCIGRHFHKRSMLLLIAGSLAVAAAFLTRYAGASLLLAGGVSLFFLSPYSWKRRFLDAAIFSILTAGPMLAWLMLSKPEDGNAANRSIVFHPPTGDHIRSFISTLGSFTGPRVQSDAVNYPFMGFTVVIAVLALWEFRRRVDTWLTLPAVFAVVYPLFLLVSISWFDLLTPLDTRILSPWHACLIVVCVGVLGRVWSPRPAIDGRRKVWVGIAVVVLASQFVGASLFLSKARDESLHFNSTRWRNSPMIRAISELPADAVVYCNASDVVWYRTRRTTRSFPRVKDPSTGLPVDEYPRRLRSMREALSVAGGYVCYFDSMGTRNKYLVPRDRLARDLDLVLDQVLPDGRIYRALPGAFPTTAPTRKP